MEIRSPVGDSLTRAVVADGRRLVNGLHRRLNRSAAPLASRGEVAAGRRDVAVTSQVPNGLDIGAGDEEARAERVPEAVERTVLSRHAGSPEEFPGPPVSPRLH